MAYDQKENRFYHDFTGVRGGSYRLMFQPAHNQDPAAGFVNDIEFPDGIFKNELSVKGGYDGDIPIGMPLTRTMKIKIDLSGFTGDFIDVGNWILEKKYSSQRIVNGVAIDIPNRWILLKESVVGAGFDVTKFDGIQDIKPKSKLPIKDGDTIFEFECLDIIRATLERVTSDDISQLTEEYTNGSYNTGFFDNVLVYNNYTVAGKTVWFLDYTGWFGHPCQIGMLSINSMISQIFDLGELVLHALIRDSAITFSNVLTLFSNIVFYQKSRDGSNTLGVPVPIQYIAAYVYNGSDKIGGLLTKTKGNDTTPYSWTNEYSNAWDLLKYLSETSRQKLVLDYDDVFGYVVYFYKMFDDINTRKSSTERTLTKADVEFINDGGLDQNDKIISQVSVSWETSGENEINELELSSRSILNENSFDTDVLINTVRPKPYKKVTSYSTSGADVVFSYYDTIDDFKIPENNLYRLGTGILTTGDKFELLHETITIDYGESITQTGDVILNPSYNVDHAALLESSKKTCDVIATTTGLSYTIAQSILDLFANTEQYIVKCKAESSKIDLNDLGNIFTIDIDELKPDGIALTYPSVTTNTVLVSVDENIYEETSICKLFKRGVNGI